MRKNKKINIIYKDDQIVVCEKPKGIPVSSDKTGDMDLLHQLKKSTVFLRKIQMGSHSFI